MIRRVRSWVYVETWSMRHPLQSGLGRFVSTYGWGQGFEPTPSRWRHPWAWAVGRWVYRSTPIWQTEESIAELHRRLAEKRERGEIPVRKVSPRFERPPGNIYTVPDGFLNPEEKEEK